MPPSNPPPSSSDFVTFKLRFLVAIATQNAPVASELESQRLMRKHLDGSEFELDNYAGDAAACVLPGASISHRANKQN